MHPHTCAKVRHDPPKGFVSANARLCAPKVFIRLVFFSVFWGVLATRYSQGRWTDSDFDAKYAKTRFHTRMCLFRVATIKSNI